MLNKPPDQITVGEVVALLEGGSILTHCSKNPEQCSRAEKCPTRYLWLEASNALFARLNQITFADLLNNGKDAHPEICASLS
jgi:DNA-binding IscR family transcriptional regulator